MTSLILEHKHAVCFLNANKSEQNYIQNKGHKISHNRWKFEQNPIIRFKLTSQKLFGEVGASVSTRQSLTKWLGQK